MIEKTIEQLRNDLDNNLVTSEELFNESKDEVIELITNVILTDFEEKTKEVPTEIITDFERQISLHSSIEEMPYSFKTPLILSILLS
mgnify:CR=1 FL=1